MTNNPVEREPFVPSFLQGAETGDVREDFARLTQRAPLDPEAERAFVRSKLHLLETQPGLAAGQRQRLAATVSATIGPLAGGAGPAPGGVGYGVFYQDAFKSNWATGTASSWEIVCPDLPGGNVTTWLYLTLYLTAMNRSAKGAEAFVSYNGRRRAFFKVFDWARPDHWQTNVALASLAGYLRPARAHGGLYRALPVLNVTSQTGPDRWYNQIWLWNVQAGRWDLFYQHDYRATQAEQLATGLGSWSRSWRRSRAPFVIPCPWALSSPSYAPRTVAPSGARGANYRWRTVTSAPTTRG